jgi:hypothetical protein
MRASAEFYAFVAVGLLLVLDVTKQYLFPRVLARPPGRPHLRQFCPRANHTPLDPAGSGAPLVAEPCDGRYPLHIHRCSRDISFSSSALASKPSVNSAA